MPDNTYTFTMPIERGKIREFATATGSTAPEYLTDPHPVIPATFLRSAAFWSDPSAEPSPDGVTLDLRRILHGEQEYTFFGEPPRAGDELTVANRVESVTHKEGKRGGSMTLVVFAQDFTDPSGRLVARSRRTLIQTEKAAS
jgi:hypothetical protein